MLLIRLIRRKGKPFLCFSLLFACIVVTADGQKNPVDGYIVNNNGDSLRGLIDYRDWGVNPPFIEFLVKRSSQVTAFSATDLRAFGVNGERYESYRVHVYPYTLHPETLTTLDDIGAAYDSTVFLQVVTAGRRMTLWEYRQRDGIRYYFVSGEGGRPDQLRISTRLMSANGTTYFQQLQGRRHPDDKSNFPCQ